MVNISLSYSFASEEYNEFVEYPDTFGLFLDGTNIALANDGSPFSARTVQMGLKEGGIYATGSCAASSMVTDANAHNYVEPQNTEQFICNDIQNGSAPYRTPFDGFTRQTFATLQIDPSEPHELVIAIGDANDRVYSSQVFLLSHSLSTLKVGCIDPEASNYDSDAQIDDEPTTCVYKSTVVWLDCDHNPSFHAIDWSQTECIGTISGSRCDVRLTHL